MGDSRSLRAVSALPLGGREEQLATLERMLTGVAAGTPGPHTLLISGEAGIGKSRLLGALLARAAASWRTLIAACQEPYQSEPYAPLVDLTTHALRALDTEMRQALLGPNAATLAMLPGLEQLAAPGGAAADPESAPSRRRLFRALCELFVGLCADQPLLLAIEDVHWCDAATLSFLPVLAEALAGQPAVLVLTYKSDETPPLLAAALADLDRRRLAVELSLPPLSRTEVHALLRALFGTERPLPALLLDTLYGLSDGNPFFVEEIAIGMLASGPVGPDGGAWLARSAADVPIPRTVQEAVRRRCAELSPAAHEVLTIAAVLGRRFSFAILHQATGHDEGALLTLLKELIGARLITEESAEQFAFRHALVRAAIYNGLLLRERRLLHRRLAEALAQAASYPGDLAHHFAEAGNWEQALHYAEIAAAQAHQIHAPHEVVAFLTHAVEAARHVSGVPLSPLLHRRGQAYEILGDFAAARADYESALAMAEASGRIEDEWQALLDLGFLWSSRDSARAGVYLRRMLDRARQLGDPTLLARSLNRFGNWHMNLDRAETARRLHEEALAIFERLGDERGLAETLDLLGVSCFIAGEMSRGAAYFNRALALWQACDDRQGFVHSTIQLAMRPEYDLEAIAAVPLAPYVASLQQAVELAAAMRWRVGEALARMHLGAHLIVLGEYGPALDLLQQSHALATEIEHQEGLVHCDAELGVLHLELLCLPEAIAYLQRAVERARATGLYALTGTTISLLARAYALQQNLEQAEALLGQGAALYADATERAIGERQLRRAAAEVALARGQPAQALRLVDSLLAATASPRDGVIPVLFWLRGQALADLRRYAAATESFAAGLNTARTQGRRPLIWRLQAGLGRVAAAQHQRDDAQRWEDAARATIDELARTLPDGALREHFRRRAEATLPRLGPLTPRQALKQVFGGLTDRELEVVRLVARGYTNRQIADALVLSERTVTTHVGHILAKLSFSSRAQIARWAAEQGIAPS
ncbi:MAG: hypothetical protein OHK0015_02660 [Chloroflexi bacterium OHK40]